MKKNTNIKNQRLAYNLVSLFLFVIANCIFIKYAHRYGPIGKLSGFIHLIITVSYFSLFDHIKVKTFDRKKELRLTLIRMPLMLLSFWLFILILKPNYDAWQLKKYGVQVLAKITRHDERRGKGTRMNLSVFEYEYNNQTYTQETDDPMEYYLLDDEIILNISKKDPEIFEIIGKSYGEVK